jgi:hypothetical protein
MIVSLVALLCAGMIGAAAAQTLPNSDSPATPGQATPKSSSAPPIQDNSFLVEEAYNQETGVVQHINTFIRQRNGDWLYTFTQEWPVPNEKHQLSYTIPALGLTSDLGRGWGLGDIALNYRYQLLGDGDAKVAIAPRISLLLPTGDKRMDRGNGGVGVQVNVPVSVVLSPAWVTHSNAGLTFTPAASNARNEKAALRDFNLDQSLIWLAKPNFNVMLEAQWQSTESIAGPHLRQRGYEFLLSPGIRWAYNFKSGLQIVPGIAVPLGVGPSQGERSLLFYLSFEHPFRKNRE